MLKYVALTALMVAAAVGSTAENKNDDITWSEVMECYKQPKTAMGCLESRMSRALVSMRSSAVRMAHSEPEVASEDVAGVGELVQEIGEFITYGISSYFRGEDGSEVAASASAGALPANQSTDVDEGRGHKHKKKKIQKEIKKFVLKVLFAIYLFKQKIKMILMSIQSILMSKFLIVAMIYALSNTFKIWYDIKWSKHHHHDKVVYYENAHHQHHYEPPEHEYEDHHDHHGWGGSIWGRSILATEPSVIEHGSSGSNDEFNNRYVRRVTRTASHPTVAAQTMAFGAQRPQQ